MVPAEPSSTAVFDLDHIDYSAFETPVPPAEIEAYRQRVVAAQQSRVGPSDPKTTSSRPMIVGILVFFAASLLACLSLIFVPVFEGHGITSWVPIELSILFAAFTAASILQTYKEFAKKNWMGRAQLPHFARDNGLELRSVSAAPAYPGMIFRQGDTRTAIDRLTTTTGRIIDLGTLEYWIRSNRSRYVVHWSYLAIRLDRKLPTMLLIAKQNQGLGGSDLPGTFRSDQILSLEGDFDRYFTLYCPKDYETDALYVFTPDLMALLIDNAQYFDVEIVNDWMFVVVRKTLPTTQSTYERLFSIARTVGAKAARQTKNYHDDNVGSFSANVVAPRGRVLRRNVSVVRVLILVVVIAALIAVPVAALIFNQLVAP